MGTANRPGLTEERVVGIMLGLRAGKTLRDLWVKASQLEAHFSTHPEYAQEARPLIETNVEAARRRRGARLSNRTHCLNGHAFAENGRDTIFNGWRVRKCRACEKVRSQRGDKMKPGVLEDVKAALKKGLTISAITKSGRPTRLLKHNALARHRRENPDFDRFVSELIKNNVARGQVLRWQRIRSAAAREEANDYYKIRAMLPAALPDKDDVVSAVFEDLLTGALKREDVKARLQTYIVANNRLFPTKYAKFGNSPLVSLDEVMFEDGSMTRGDTVSRGLWD
jgi:hypothetical protein